MTKQQMEILPIDLRDNTKRGKKQMRKRRGPYPPCRCTREIKPLLKKESRKGRNVNQGLLDHSLIPALNNGTDLLRTDPTASISRLGSEDETVTSPTSPLPQFCPCCVLHETPGHAICFLVALSLFKFLHTPALSCVLALSLRLSI